MTSTDPAPAPPLNAIVEGVHGFGLAVRGTATVQRPTSAEQVADVFREARGSGAWVGLRGAGRSYGDASMNSGHRVLDLTSMRRVLAFDPLTGRIEVEPGILIRDLWRVAIRFGYWPPVVPGTMYVSMGGAAGMNIHGKNNYAAGSFGEHILEFDLVTPEGQLLTCNREQHADVFHAAIGGFGMLGCMTRIAIQLKPVPSGRLKVWGIVAKDLAHNIEILEDLRGEADYLVSWLDLHAKGAALGRGIMHRADQYKAGEDPEGLRFFDPVMQDVPEAILGVPKGWLWPGMWVANRLKQIGAVNALKFRMGPREQRQSPYPQSHGGFHFLLDYVPNWQFAFRPGGLIQFQPFLPAAEGERVLKTLIERSQQARLVPYLGVLKRHRPDPFLMTHAVDGYSLAMDFAVSANDRERKRLWEHCRRLADIVLEAGGRFYYAKDAVLEGDSFTRIHGEAAVDSFRAMKARLDPGHLLQTDLSRRLMGP